MNSDRSVQSVGRLCLVTCQSQPLEIDLERDRVAKKHGGLEGDLSEVSHSGRRVFEGTARRLILPLQEDSDSDYEDAPLDSDINEPSSGRSAVRYAACLSVC